VGNENQGSGIIRINQDDWGVYINSESKGKDFVKDTLCLLVDQAEIVDWDFSTHVEKLYNGFALLVDPCYKKLHFGASTQVEKITLDYFLILIFYRIFPSVSPGGENY
jgi:hypothetical protein